MEATMRPSIRRCVRWSKGPLRTSSWNCGGIRRRSTSSMCRATGSEDGTSWNVGDAVRVVESVVVYHVPKKNQGVDLKGMEGQVVSDARQYKGKEISANLPWKVQFEMEAEEPGKKNTKFFAHLEEHEMERIG